MRPTQILLALLTVVFATSGCNRDKDNNSAAARDTTEETQTPRQKRITDLKTEIRMLAVAETAPIQEQLVPLIAEINEMNLKYSSLEMKELLVGSWRIVWTDIDMPIERDGYEVIFADNMIWHMAGQLMLRAEYSVDNEDLMFSYDRILRMPEPLEAGQSLNKLALQAERGVFDGNALNNEEMNAVLGKEMVVRHIFADSDMRIARTVGREDAKIIILEKVAKVGDRVPARASMRARPVPIEDSRPDLPPRIPIN